MRPIRYLLVLPACLALAATAYALSPARLIETGYLRPLSKNHADERLPDGWVKPFADMFDVRGLVDADGKQLLRTKGSPVYADRLVGDDLYALGLAYREANGASLRITSAYRSVEEQAHLYAAYRARGDERFSTPAGTSEHHLGTTFDFGLGEGDIRYTWLAEHAAAYGFVLSYPPECQKRTGVTSEPWHYRWIGRELAAEYIARRDASEGTYCTVDFYQDKIREAEEERRLAAARAEHLRALEEASRSQTPATGTRPTPADMLRPLGELFDIIERFVRSRTGTGTVVPVSMLAPTR